MKIRPPNQKCSKENEFFNKKNEIMDINNFLGDRQKKDLMPVPLGSRTWIPPSQINTLKAKYGFSKNFMYITNLDLDSLSEVHGFENALGFEDVSDWVIKDMINLSFNDFYGTAYYLSGLNAYDEVEKYLIRHRDGSKLVYSVERPVLDANGEAWVLQQRSRLYRTYNNQVLANLNTCSVVRRYKGEPFAIQPKIYRETNGRLHLERYDTERLRKKIGADLINYLGFTSEELDILEFKLEKLTNEQVCKKLGFTSSGLKKTWIKSIKSKAVQISPFFGRKSTKVKIIAEYLRKIHCI